MRRYPDAGDTAPLGSIAVQGQGRDLAIVTYGNGTYLSTQTQARLKDAGINARIVDLRWLAPLADDAVLAATKDCKRVLIVDECRRTGSQSEALTSLFAEHGRKDVARVTAKDSFIATGPAYGATLPSADGIFSAARELVQNPE